METSNSPQAESEQDQQEPRRLEDILSRAKSWRVQRLAMRETMLAAPSVGERALPWLMIVIESCCIVIGLIGLASLGIGGNELIVPLWTPFLLIGVTYGVVTRLSKSEQTQKKGLGMVGGIVATLLLLFICWARFYSSAGFFLDPRWLLSLISDLLFLNGQAFLILFICLCSALMIWQAIRLSSQVVEPSQCIRLLVTGLVVLGLVILIRLATPENPSLAYANLLLLFMIPIYISLSLGAHALAHIILLRRFHPDGLDGSEASQEGSLVVAMGIWGLLLVAFALIIASVISPDFLVLLQHLLVMLGTIYTWLVDRLVDLLTLLVSPIIWLLSFFHLQINPQPVRPLRGSRYIPTHKPTPPDFGFLVLFSKIFIIVMIVLVVVMIVWLLKGVKRRVSGQKRAQDVHESVWSWALFRKQLRLLFLALFGRFFRRRNTGIETAKVDDLRVLEPAVRNIREIYRALLKRAASLGLPRHVSETPDEFHERLRTRTPEAEEGLTTITRAYLETRYGGAVPDSDEVARVRQEWLTVEQQWRNVKS